MNTMSIAVPRWPVMLSTLAAVAAVGIGGRLIYDDVASVRNLNAESAVVAGDRLVPLRTLRDGAAAAAGAMRKAVHDADPAQAAADAASAEAALDSMKSSLLAVDTAVRPAAAQALVAQVDAGYWNLAGPLRDAAAFVRTGDREAAAALLGGDVNAAETRLSARIDGLATWERTDLRDRRLAERTAARRRLSLAMAPVLLAVGICMAAAFRAACR